MTEFMRENPRPDHIMMFDFPDYADKCLGKPGTFPVTGSEELVA